MGGIGRFLTSPLATVQGDPLTLADLLFTVASVLFFYLLAQVAAGQFRRKVEPRLRVTATNKHLLRSTVYLSILIAGIYTSLVTTKPYLLAVVE